MSSILREMAFESKVHTVYAMPSLDEAPSILIETLDDVPDFIGCCKLALVDEHDVKMLRSSDGGLRMDIEKLVEIERTCFDGAKGAFMALRKLVAVLKWYAEVVSHQLEE